MKSAQHLDLLSCLSLMRLRLIELRFLDRLIDKLDNNRLYREHYQDFVEDFTYGRSLSFDEAVASLSDLTRRLIK